MLLLTSDCYHVDQSSLRELLSTLELRKANTIGANESRSLENQRGETAPAGSDTRSNGIDRYFVDDIDEDHHLSSGSNVTKSSSGRVSDKKSKHLSFIRKVKHIGKDLLHDDSREEEHEKFFSFHKSKKNNSGLIEWDEREEHRQGLHIQKPPGLGTQLRTRRPSVTEMKAKVRETSRSNSFGYGVGGPSPPKPPPLVADRTAVDDLIDESSKEDFCPTCLEPYDAENPKIVAKCGHSYHLACLYEWLERSPYCPICAARMEFAEDTLNAIPEEEP